MKEKKLDTFVQLRMLKTQKEKWKKIAIDKKTTITDMVINSVEETLSKSEKGEILKFIEMQGNIFAKIENNFNQIARKVNSEKSISQPTMTNFLEHVKILNNLKAEQNRLFKTIVKLLAK